MKYNIEKTPCMECQDSYPIQANAFSGIDWAKQLSEFVGGGAAGFLLPMLDQLTANLITNEVLRAGVSSLAGAGIATLVEGAVDSKMTDDFAAGVVGGSGYHFVSKAWGTNIDNFVTQFIPVIGGGSTASSSVQNTTNTSGCSGSGTL